MSESIQVESMERGITTVILNRPARRNALNIELLAQLAVVVDRLTHDPIERVLILRGAGPVFCAGLDLHEAVQADLVERSAYRVHQVVQSLRNTQLVTLAVVQGGAFAGGAGLVAACDIVLASSDAMFGFPEARRGLLPALILGVLRDRIRDGDLRDVLLVGDPFDAQRAQTIGLVQRIVPSDQLLSEAARIARSVLRGGPQTVRETKKLLNARLGNEADAEHSIATHLDARRSVEAREGLAAFVEKREPHWP